MRDVGYSQLTINLLLLHCASLVTSGKFVGTSGVSDDRLLITNRKYRYSGRSDQTLQPRTRTNTWARTAELNKDVGWSKDQMIVTTISMMEPAKFSSMSKPSRMLVETSLNYRIPHSNPSVINFEELSNHGEAFSTASNGYMAYVVGLLGIVLIVLICALVWHYTRWRAKKVDALWHGRSSPSASYHVHKQMCMYPQAKPTFVTPSLVQPDGENFYSQPAPSSLQHEFHDIKRDSFSSSTPPMPIRKSILERRGSNASLTLDLGPSLVTNVKPAWGSPPKESSAEEYLLSAGNRLSRKELRSVMKNVPDIYQEFWEIPMNHPKHISVTGSGMKNRYKTIIPNEHSRVVLKGKCKRPITCYINANYIRGCNNEEKAYIATQGPMSHTVVDFWRMIWQEKSPVIVMITKLKEKNKSQCDSYLPDNEGQDQGVHVYGDLQVQVLSYEEQEDYILRQLKLEYHDETHLVLHYWYVSWPDHKAPSTAVQLLRLAQEVDQQRFDALGVKGPVVVHCSAGIGRTGCFIATSIGVQQLREEGMVDILGIVCAMRLDRGGMVQTNEQYAFIYQALCCYEQELSERSQYEE